MLFLWKYVDDLIGKGLPWYTIVELLLYSIPMQINYSLPISILISSIMSLGNMGEHYELTAMKSSGVSLRRIMRPLFGLIIIIAIGAFLSSNYLIPYTNFKSKNLLENIANTKPALNIREGIFYNGIEGFSLKVGEKYGPENDLLKDVLIYDHTESRGNVKVIIAEKGRMYVTEDENYLVITLENGYSYEEVKTRTLRERDRKPHQKTKFLKDEIRMDLSSFKTGDLKEENYERNYKMMNIGQLFSSADSLQTFLSESQEQLEDRINARYYFARSNARPPDEDEDRDQAKLNTMNLVEEQIKQKAEKNDSAKQEALQAKPNKKASKADVSNEYYTELNDTILLNIKPVERAGVMNNALRLARSTKELISQEKDNNFWYHKRLIAKHFMEFHRKLALAFASIVLFFVGAPLGAIIRKGGLGLPVVIAIVIYLLFHIISITFEKMGREHIVSPFFAMWSATLIMLPLGVFLTQKATTDSSLFNYEVYAKPVVKLFSFFGKFFKK